MEHNKIYVGSLSSCTTGSDLKNAFSEFGTIDEVKLITDMYTGDSKGFAFIKFSTNSSASKALEMNGKIIKERTIRVSLAKKKESLGGGARRRW